MNQGYNFPNNFKLVFWKENLFASFNLGLSSCRPTEHTDFDFSSDKMGV